MQCQCKMIISGISKSDNTAQNMNSEHPPIIKRLYICKQWIVVVRTEKKLLI